MPLPANVSSVFGHLGKPDSEPDSDAQPSTTVRPASLPSKLPHRSLPKPSPTAQASLVGPREALLGGGCPRVNQSRATNPEDTRSKKRKAGSGPNLDGEEGDGKELGGLLLQLQRHREERERVDCARRASSEKDERSACKGTRVDVIVGRGVRPGDRDTEKLDVLEHIVEACPRGSVFEFHKYLMGVKDEEFGDFICLCAALLSVQCLDHVAMKACEKLRSGFPGGFSVQAVAASSPQELEPLINTCNYYKGKAKKIHSCACTLLRKHKGKVPQAQASLLELDGVGPKIAHLVLSVGLGKRAEPQPILELDPKLYQRQTQNHRGTCSQSVRNGMQLLEPFDAAMRDDVNETSFGGGQSLGVAALRHSWGPGAPRPCAGWAEGDSRGGATYQTLLQESPDP